MVPRFHDRMDDILSRAEAALRLAHQIEAAVAGVTLERPWRSVA